MQCFGSLVALTEACFFLPFYALDDEPHSQSELRNEHDRKQRISQFLIGGEEAELNETDHQAQTIQEKQYAKKPRQESGLDDQIAEGEEPDAIEKRCNHVPAAAQIEEKHQIGR